MTEEDVKAIVRAIKAAQAEEFEQIHERFKKFDERLEKFEQQLDGLSRRINEVEGGLLNEIRALGRRVARLEAGP